MLQVVIVIVEKMTSNKLKLFGRVMNVEERKKRTKKKWSDKIQSDMRTSGRYVRVDDVSSRGLENRWPTINSCN